MKPAPPRTVTPAPSPADGATLGLSWVAGATLAQSVGPEPEGVPARPEGPLGARYEDLGLLGRGGMGEVRRVWDRLLERVVALKILRPELASSPSYCDRFLSEARVVAALQHPGIVPLYDLGWLPDRRPFFTMKEVQGRTLRELLKEVHAASAEARWAPSPGGWTLRRLVEALRDASVAVAFAHSRAVLHRDLKPQNILVGEYGEVVVVDWGLARPLELPEPPPLEEPPGRPPARSQSRSIATPRGQVVGTPAYMAPEQAQGDIDRVGPATDVYSLGATLQELLTGAPPPREGAPPPRPAPPAPEELLRVVRRALAPRVEERLPDAAAFAAELDAWLVGLRRRERALAELAQAEDHRATAQALRAAAAAQTAAVHRQRLALPSWTPVPQKQPLWTAEDEAARLALQADLAEERVRRALNAALMHDPELPEARERLAADAWERLLAAEARRDPAQAALAEAALRAWDPVHAAHRLRVPSGLSLETDPPGAEVLLYRMVSRDRRLEPVFERSLGHTPLCEVPVPAGSLRLTLRAPGHHEVLLPLHLARGERWANLPPGSPVPAPVWLPPLGALAPHEVYIPAGWFVAGGDPRANLSLAPKRVWIDSYTLGRDPVTNAEYIAFLDDLVAQGREGEALRWAPRERPGILGTLGAMIYGRDPQGRFTLVPDADGDLWALDWPVCYVDWACAQAYTRWLAERTGQPWRLPCELEWEKAARGADARAFPWGDHFEPTWACVRGCSPERSLLTSVHAYPLDLSPYGVRGLGGNVQDWCLDPWRAEGPGREGERLTVQEEPSDQHVMRGGYFFAGENLSRCASRGGFVSTAKDGGRGFRVARGLGGR